MQKIILASASPRRKELLEQTGMKFEIYPATGEEKITKKQPQEVVQELAEQKAKEVALYFQKKLQDGLEETKKNPIEKEDITTYLVIGADTLVAYEDRILGKPKSEQEAMEMLSMLSNATHSVYTGVTIAEVTAQEIKNHSFYKETKVTMYPICQEEIQKYVATKEPVDKAGNHIWNTDKQQYYWEGRAGGYGIQDPFGMKYIREIEGDYYNVVGLPVSRLFQELLKIGVDL